MSESENPFESRFGATSVPGAAATSATPAQSAAVQPMRIGQLLDRALRLTPGVFQKFIILFVIQALCVAVSQMPAYEVNMAIRGVGSLVQMVLSFYLMVAMPLLAARHWKGEKVSLSALRKDISFSLIFRVFGLLLRVGLVTGLLMILLVIPGIIYFVNRILAIYILIIEKTSISDSLKKSKKLMLGEKWYRSGSPWMRVTGLLLLIMVVSIFASVPTIGATLLIAQGTDVIPLLLLGALFLGSFIQLFVQTFGSLAYVGFYNDLLARYEATDILSGIDEIEAS